MKSLVITALPPLRPTQNVTGAHLRQAMFLRSLAGISSQMEILAFAIEADIATNADTAAMNGAQSRHWGCPITMNLIPIARRTETFWSHYGAGMGAMSAQPGFYHYAGPAQIASVAHALARQPDLVFVFGISAMLPVLRAKLRPRQMFFDLNDVEHKVRLRTALTRPFRAGKMFYIAQMPAILAAEYRGTRNAKATFVCSKNDARHLLGLGFGSGVTVVPNALAMPEKPPCLIASPTLLFIGSYGYQPNSDAANRLLAVIWPKIRAQVPMARLIIAGRDGDRLSGAVGAEGVEFTGFVDDLGALYARTRIVLCPIATGGGTRIKLIEAASYGRPIVSTRIGAEGLELGDGVEILLRDDDSDFADACIRLLQDDALCIRLGTAARAKMASHYEVGRVETQIRHMFLSAQDTAA